MPWVRISPVAFLYRLVFSDIKIALRYLQKYVGTLSLDSMKQILVSSEKYLIQKDILFY